MMSIMMQSSLMNKSYILGKMCMTISGLRSGASPWMGLVSAPAAGCRHSGIDPRPEPDVSDT